MNIAFDDIAFVLGTRAYTWLEVLMGVSAMALVLLLVLILVNLRGTSARRHALDIAQQRAKAAETQIASIMQSQAEMQGRLGTIAEVFGSRQNELNENLQQRLDAMTTRIGQSMTDQQKATHENLSKLQERLAVIDTAQTNIQSLAGQVVQLQSILSNKQSRGAFGQSRMEAIVQDGLPQGGYDFQPTLSNNTRPDCIIHMPNDAPGLVIDAKFPLEGWNAIRDADEAAMPAAIKSFRSSVEYHVKDIASKYLLKGETQETAFLFVPSESIFADLHEHHGQVIEKAHKARIVIVSPSLLMLSVQVIQALLKDVRMREQAHLIQVEVTRLMDDVMRLDDRVRKLQGHFGQAAKDIDDILISSGKVTKRGRKIEELDFEPVETAPKPVVKTTPKAESKTGQLRLHVVDGEGN
ncbi:MAG: DNA recombination protein RmuC [Pseudomonadota bacterium]